MRTSCKNIVKTLSNIQQDLHALIGKLFENNLAAIHEKKTSLTLNKPYMQDLQYQKQVNGKCIIFNITL